MMAQRTTLGAIGVAVPSLLNIVERMNIFFFTFMFSSVCMTSAFKLFKMTQTSLHITHGTKNTLCKTFAQKVVVILCHIVIQCHTTLRQNVEG